MRQWTSRDAPGCDLAKQGHDGCLLYELEGLRLPGEAKRADVLSAVTRGEAVGFPDVFGEPAKQLEPRRRVKEAKSCDGVVVCFFQRLYPLKIHDVCKREEVGRGQTEDWVHPGATEIDQKMLESPPWRVKEERKRPSHGSYPANKSKEVQKKTGHHACQ